MPPQFNEVQAVQLALVVGSSNLGNVVDRVGQVRGQNVNDQRLDPENRIARQDGQRQFNVFLKLWFFIVDGNKVE